ncbi:MAG: hypothetical protein V3V10_02480, partial [Planctomycetota bacterium]
RATLLGPVGASTCCHLCYRKLVVTQYFELLELAKPELVGDFVDDSITLPDPTDQQPNETPIAIIQGRPSSEGRETNFWSWSLGKAGELVSGLSDY